MNRIGAATSVLRACDGTISKHIVVVCGNIGAGKTTLAERLSSALKWRLESEPVEENPYLPLFYEDMGAWALHLQLHFLGRRIAQYHRAMCNFGSVVLDRSIFEDYFIFAQTLHRSGLLSEIDFSVYRSVFDGVFKFITPPSAIVYLTAPVERLVARIGARGRPFERTITSDYLHKLDQAYTTWIDSVTFCPVFKLASPEEQMLEIGPLIQSLTGL